MSTPIDLTPYKPQTWIDVPEGTTAPPEAIREDAAAFNRMELGISRASQVAIAAYNESAIVFLQNTPAASWAIDHDMGRLPQVQVYVAGVVVDTDVAATTTQVFIVFPSPTAGAAVLT